MLAGAWKPVPVGRRMSEERAGGRVDRRTLGLCLVFGAHLLWLALVHGRADGGRLCDTFYLFSTAAPALALAWAARRLAADGQTALARAWRLMAAAQTCLWVADSGWAVVTWAWRPDEAWQAANPLFIPHYVLMAVGLAAAAGPVPRAERWRHALDLWIVVVSLCVLSWATVVAPVLHRPDTPRWFTAFFVAYLVLNLGPVCALMHYLLTRARRRLAQREALLLAAVACRLAFDWASGCEFASHDFASGSGGEVLLLFSYTLLTLAAAWPPADQPPEDEPAGTLLWTAWLPYFWVVLVFAALGWQRLEPLPPWPEPTVLGGALVLALVIARQLAVQQQNSALAAQAGRELADRRLAEAALQRSEQALREANGRLVAALEELRASQAQAVRRERLSALGAMSRGIAHDLNNSLSSVIGFVDLLRGPDGLADPETVRADLDAVALAAHDAASVVRRLRDFYRPAGETAEQEPVELATVVADAIALAQPRWRNEALAAGTTIGVAHSLEAGLYVLGNEGELREAVLNLLVNAVDAILAKRSRGHELLHFDLRRDHHDARLLLADTGEGMTPEVLAHCLEPFYTTKHDAAHGLGLSLVYGAVTRHGGSLALDSEPGAGTTVTVRLPACEPAAAPTAAPTAAPAPAAEAGSAVPAAHSLSPVWRVLVAEDQAAMRLLYGTWLAQAGHLAHTVNDGRRALDWLEAERCDLLLTDYAMPELNGAQLAVAVKERWPHLPVVMVTGFGDLLLAAGERPAGVDLLLSKPIGAARFRQLLAEVEPLVAALPAPTR